MVTLGGAVWIAQGLNLPFAPGSFMTGDRTWIVLGAIAVVGAIVIAGEERSTLSTVLGTLAVTASTINVVGGFLITDRMLKMFKKREPGAR